ncbi:hypothetical protein [Kitasatospora paranensis]|uniref:Uncharacterized protein n=1 Tax=Kitasatospora paranensis TaxID=258053 RepID=A0ABW2G3N4_9ACTN
MSQDKDQALRRERELAEQEAERQYQAAQAAELAVARSWWTRLTPAQREGLAAAVNRQAWKEMTARAGTALGEIAPQFAYGWPARTAGSRRGIYGIVRPCPALVAHCPSCSPCGSSHETPGKRASWPRPASTPHASPTSTSPTTSRTPSADPSAPARSGRAGLAPKAGRRAAPEDGRMVGYSWAVVNGNREGRSHDSRGKSADDDRSGIRAVVEAIVRAFDERGDAPAGGGRPSPDSGRGRRG